MSALANLHFLRPLALLLLLALPLFWVAWRHGRSDAGAWRAAVDAHLLPHLIERIDGGSGRAGIVLGALLWGLACVALAGPAWEREAMPLYRNQAARVLALELAPTMLAQDEKPSRLARARYKINDILNRSRDYQTALIGYAGDAFVAAPLTDDVETVRNLVDALDPGTMPVAGNATARAIDKAADLIEQAGGQAGEIILLADSAGPDAVAAARKARARGFTVSVLGIGTAAGAPVSAPGGFLQDGSGNVVVARLDAAGLRAVASAGGGRYAGLTADAHDVDTLLADRVEGADKAAATATAGESVESARWRDRGPWLLLVLLPLALCGFRRGWLMLFALAFVLPPPAAQAASWRDLWQRPDQQAAAALARGDAKQAAQVAQSPQWRGSAAYRAGDYAAAADDYARVDSADGAYNHGNALARLGRYEEAIAAYDAALKRAPDMADASANRQAVEDFLKQQQQKQQNPQQSEQGGQKNKQEQPAPQDQKGEQQGRSDQQNGQGQQDQKDQPPGQPQDSSAQAEQSKDAQDRSGQDKGQQDGREPPSEAGADQQQPVQAQEPDAEQQKALSQSIDQALADGKKPADKDARPQAVPAPEDEATREKQQAMEHLLQRVPDDPGGLLRRKFQLEYQRRQPGGGQGE